MSARTLKWFLVAAAALAFALDAAAQIALPGARVGQDYNFQIVTSPAASAGTEYEASGLPAGLSIGVSSGLISGTPSIPGTASGTISLTADGVTNSFDYTLAVAAAAGTPVITSAASASATVGIAFNYAATASNTPTSFNLDGLPPGLSGNAAGEISGVPTTAGAYAVSVS